MPTVQLVKIPKGAENMEEATIARWLKSEGDPVSSGEPIVEALTDKADFELEAEADGILRRIIAAEKSTLPVGYVIAIIAGADEELPDVDAQNQHLLDERREELVITPPDRAQGSWPRGGRVAATGRARRLAQKHDLDLAEIAAALDLGRPLTAEDVEAYLKTRRSQ